MKKRDKVIKLGMLFLRGNISGEKPVSRRLKKIYFIRVRVIRVYYYNITVSGLKVFLETLSKTIYSKAQELGW